MYKLLANDVAVWWVDLLVIVIDLTGDFESLLLIEVQRLLIRSLNVQVDVGDVGVTLGILKNLAEELRAWTRRQERRGQGTEGQATGTVRIACEDGRACMCVLRVFGTDSSSSVWCQHS